MRLFSWTEVKKALGNTHTRHWRPAPLECINALAVYTHALRAQSKHLERRRHVLTEWKERAFGQWTTMTLLPLPETKQRNGRPSGCAHVDTIAFYRETSSQEILAVVIPKNDPDMSLTVAFSRIKELKLPKELKPKELKPKELELPTILRLSPIIFGCQGIYIDCNNGAIGFRHRKAPTTFGIRKARSTEDVYVHHSSQAPKKGWTFPCTIWDTSGSGICRRARASLRPQHDTI